MIRLNVWITFENGVTVLCGEMLCSDPDDRGRKQGAFRYDNDYLHHPLTFAIDPVALPFVPGNFETDLNSGVFQVFEDSLPDTWGRRLLVRKVRLPRSMQNLPALLKAQAGAGLGALSFFDEGFEPGEENFVSVIEMENLLSEALQFEKGFDVNDDQIRLLLKAGSSPGGGRPKALVQTKDGDQWIAKFGSIHDRLNIVEIEAATMSLAVKAGIAAPETRILDVSGRKVLLVKRFDVTEKGGRCHMISFQTLLQIDPGSGYYHLGYRDLYDILRKYGAQPEKDIPALYRQMVFNAFVGNTDDHLKNFILLGSRNGYRLSPAFDLLPDTENRQEHVFHFTYDYYFPGRNHLIDFGKRLGIPESTGIVHRIVDVISDWKKEFTKFGVPENDIENLSTSISRRLKEK